jgi:hypothetical protein
MPRASGLRPRAMAGRPVASCSGAHVRWRGPRRAGRRPARPRARRRRPAHAAPEAALAAAASAAQRWHCWRWPQVPARAPGGGQDATGNTAAARLSRWKVFRPRSHAAAQAVRRPHFPPRPCRLSPCAAGGCAQPVLRSAWHRESKFPRQPIGNCCPAGSVRWSCPPPPALALPHRTRTGDELNAAAATTARSPQQPGATRTVHSPPRAIEQPSAHRPPGGRDGALEG